ncbi:shikimate kinase [Leifsonia sp. A12D58]|uniref:shikimate kinase n=1 Tax=Leifsonia sp. A12D58 TaxID=3397674 RepID=UPI0039E0671E
MLPVVLIGPMAAGKSKIGSRVAAVLDLPFIDTDMVIVDRHGAISDIFAAEGEEHFRELEAEAIAEALGAGAGAGAIISIGGGGVLHPATRELLADAAVVYLSVDADSVKSRIGGGKRPLLKNGLADWLRIYEERRPTYEELATIHIDTSNRDIDSIADEVAAWVRGK